MNIKTIYEFDVNIEKEVEKVETKNENGAEITTKIKSKELVPVYFAYKKTSRGERETCEEFRAAAWGKAVEKGIMTEAIALKHFNNLGGILSDGQKKDYTDILAEIQKKSDELKGENVDKDSVNKKIAELSEQIAVFQRQESAFFENTAEVKARLKAIEWLTLNMSYFKEDKTKDWEPFFKGETLEKKYEYSDKLEEDKNELYFKTRDKLMLISALFLSLGNNIKKEDIESFG
jgi:chemotaxis response regulator CheB